MAPGVTDRLAGAPEIGEDGADRGAGSAARPGAFIDVAVRTGELPAAESVRRHMGSTADAYVEIAACAPISGIEYHDHRPFANSSCDQERTDKVDLAALLPPGSTWIETNLGDDFGRLSHGEPADLPQQLDTRRRWPTACSGCGGALPPRSVRSPRPPRQQAHCASRPVTSLPPAGRPGQVVGIVVEPSCLGCESAWACPGPVRRTVRLTPRPVQTPSPTRKPQQHGSFWSTCPTRSIHPVAARSVRSRCGAGAQGRSARSTPAAGGLRNRGRPDGHRYRRARHRFRLDRSVPAGRHRIRGRRPPPGTRSRTGRGSRRRGPPCPPDRAGPRRGHGPITRPWRFRS